MQTYVVTNPGALTHEESLLGVRTKLDKAKELAEKLARRFHLQMGHITPETPLKWHESDAGDEWECVSKGGYKIAHIRSFETNSDVVEEQAAHPLRVLYANGQDSLGGLAQLDEVIRQMTEQRVSWVINCLGWIEVSGSIIMLPPNDDGILSTQKIATALNTGLEAELRRREQQRQNPPKLHKPEVRRDGKQ